HCDPGVACAGRRGLGRGPRLSPDPRPTIARQGAAARDLGRRPGSDRRRRPAHGAAGARGLRHALAPVSDRRCDVDGAAPGAVGVGKAERAFIVEDDYTSEFRYSGPPLASLQGLDDSEQVIYVGTLNKALFIGYAVVPRALRQAFIGARYLIDRQPATLQQAVVSEFMQQGHFAAHIRRMRQLYREQRDALAETLTRRAAARLDVALPDQGMHLVAYLRDGSSDVAVEAAALRAGIVVRAIRRFYRPARRRAGLMLGFSGFPRQLIVPAAARLATLVAHRGRN